MNVLILFTIIIVVVFVVTFISGRRFGALALSLATGALFSSWWSADLAGVMSKLGISPILGLSREIIASVILLLAPLVFSLLSGPTYKKKMQRVIASFLTALLLSAFLMHELGQHMSLQGDLQKNYEMVSNSWKYTATVGLILGLIDLFLARNHKKLKMKEH